jgi:hypothetical protein
MVCEIIYGDQCIVIPDHRLTLLMQILLRCLDQIDAPVPSSARWREVWSQELKNRVFGMLDLNLSEILQDENDMADFKRLLEFAKEKARSFGVEITPAQFDQLVQSKTMWLVKALPTSRLEDDIDRIAAMV